MSINRLISIKNAIVNAMEDCGLDHDKDIPVLTRWAIEAEKAISSNIAFTRKHAVLDINHCIACLPDDAAYLEAAILGDLGCDCGDIFAKVCSNYIGNRTTLATSADANSFLIVDMGQGTSIGLTSVDHQVQDNKIVLARDLDGQKLTIQYKAYDVDCEGFLNVSENHIKAIGYYCCWKFFLRKKRPAGEDYYKIKEFKTEWNRECANARAKDAVLSASDRAKIVAMHHDPYIGYSLNVGMRTTLGNYYW